MDTTIEDFARFAAGFMRGEGLSKASRKQLVSPQLAITNRAQFPTLAPEALPGERWSGLSAGLGVVVVDGPQGRVFLKSGHNDSTGNSWVTVKRSLCVALVLGRGQARAGGSRVLGG